MIDALRHAQVHAHSMQRHSSSRLQRRQPPPEPPGTYRDRTDFDVPTVASRPFSVSTTNPVSYLSHPNTALPSGSSTRPPVELRHPVSPDHHHASYTHTDMDADSPNSHSARQRFRSRHRRRTHLPRQSFEHAEIHDRGVDIDTRMEVEVADQANNSHGKSATVSPASVMLDHSHLVQDDDMIGADLRHGQDVHRHSSPSNDRLSRSYHISSFSSTSSSSSSQQPIPTSARSTRAHGTPLSPSSELPPIPPPIRRRSKKKDAFEEIIASTVQQQEQARQLLDLQRQRSSTSSGADARSVGSHHSRTRDPADNSIIRGAQMLRRQLLGHSHEGSVSGSTHDDHSDGWVHRRGDEQVTELLTVHPLRRGESDYNSVKSASSNSSSTGTTRMVSPSTLQQQFPSPPRQPVPRNRFFEDGPVAEGHGANTSVGYMEHAVADQDHNHLIEEIIASDESHLGANYDVGQSPPAPILEPIQEIQDEDDETVGRSKHSHSSGKTAAAATVVDRRFRSVQQSTLSSSCDCDEDSTSRGYLNKWITPMSSHNGSSMHISNSTYCMQHQLEDANPATKVSPFASTVLSPIGPQYVRLLRNDVGFQHATNSGLLWQSLVSQHVRFPKTWWKGARNPPMGILPEPTTTKRARSDASEGSTIDRQSAWKYFGRHRVGGNPILNQEFVRNRGAAGRILLHIIVRDTDSLEPVQDIAIGVLHPNARGVRPANAEHNPSWENCRDVWMALRNRPRNEGGTLRRDSVLESLVTAHASHGSPLGQRKAVDNGNMRVVFGDRPPVQTAFLLESELRDVLATDASSVGGAELQGQHPDMPPALMLLEAYLRP